MWFAGYPGWCLPDIQGIYAIILPIFTFGVIHRYTIASVNLLKG